jgi:hypothetical protein
VKKVLLALLLVVCVATVANAQATRTWVSGVGDDVNPCSRTAPCKTFAGAISKTAAGGTISTLDPGGFGAVTITKSITIDGSEQIAGVLAAGTNGVVVNALTTDDIHIRNLDINGANTGFDGVRVLQARSVYVENCRIQQFSSNGIEVANSSNAIHLFVMNSEIKDINAQGIFVNSTATGTARLVMQNSHVSLCNSNAVDVAAAGSTATLFHTVVSDSANGLVVQPTSSTAFAEESVFSYNGVGVFSGVGGATPVIRLSRCLVVGNTTNGIGGTGTVVGFQNNTIVGNSGSNAVSSSTAQQ